MKLPVQSQPVIRKISMKILTMPSKAVMTSECDGECGTGMAATLASCAASDAFPPAIIACVGGLIGMATTQSCRGCMEEYMKELGRDWTVHERIRREQ